MVLYYFVIKYLNILNRVHSWHHVRSEHILSLDIMTK